MLNSRYARWWLENLLISLSWGDPVGQVTELPGCRGILMACALFVSCRPVLAHLVPGFPIVDETVVVIGVGHVPAASYTDLIWGFAVVVIDTGRRRWSVQPLG